MTITKREFLKISTMAGTAAVVAAACGEETANAKAKPRLTAITRDAVPIGTEERLQRIAKAQALMEKHAIDAIVVEPGSAMLYFSGISWWRSERLTALIVPREGEIGIVTPYFEEPSVRESMTFGDDVRPWHEHEDPFARVAGILKDRGLDGGKIGLEETVRYFVADGLKKATRGFEIVPALPVTAGCRMYKSENELALMRKANEVTLGAYEHVYASLEKGMSSADVSELMRQAQSDLGGEGNWNMALFGPASAYPHGTSQPQEIAEGQIVLMDCGCKVEGYQSDISRTFVYGEPTRRQREVWETVRQGQQIAFETAMPGTPAGEVDDAVRKYYESLGYGPGYATPGLSHRTGHGIGMDVHEHVNFVHLEEQPLAPGMCFSNEPGIYIFDEFGVRLEDCIYMTEDGPAWFTVPPDSLESPLGRMA